MIKDLRQEKNHNSFVETKICIVGAGAAGITLAMAFEQLGIPAVLLEGGGLNYPGADELDLYDAKIGSKPYPIERSRLRYFGGSTNHWGGWSHPLEDFDFSDKPYFPEKGWPINKEEIYQYYPGAAKVCEIPNFEKSYNGYFSSALKRGVLDWGNSIFTNKFFVFSPPTRFGEKYLDTIENAETIETYLYANATELLFNQDRITGVIAHSLNGNRLQISAEKTILAMGGLENPRFMLNARNKYFDQGVGNQSDWLGRCFMDHAGFRPIELLLTEGLNYKRHLFEGFPVMPVISMNKEALLNNQLNNFCVMLERKKDDDFLSREYAKNPWLSQSSSPYGNYNAQFIFEPSPCKASRVTLVDELDKLGKRKLRLDWNFNKRDFESVENVVKLMIREFGAKHLGRIKWKKFFEPKTIKSISGGMHHAGTTRMSISEAGGVVDENCRVHGAKGLYVLGNSVFSHVGFSNPTVTIVALALRLADHIKALSE